ncbi:LytTR family DNA-binding domain-containing protein [Tenacibaculum sp. 190524A05c]|uniref:LytTR family DNA-binding domain-containing protein n=1 Tax=Tenacibaculum platacis TaxID=3137852 RepID=UPI0032B10EF7
MNKLNPSIKHHTYVAIFISLWIFIFTYYIRPFDGGSYSLYWWEFLSFGYAIIAFLCYFIVAMIQDSIYRLIERWNIALELLIICVFHFLNLVLTFLYYKSPFLRGIWTFDEYTSGILKSAIIFTPIIIFGRILTLKYLPKEEKNDIQKDHKTNSDNETITVRGEYKLDILKLKKAELVCISKSQNYVEVFFIEKENLNSKLIRSSLKKIQNEFDFLIQVHRSHLINPMHFRSWKTNNSILLTQIEIPVSKNYKVNLDSL